MAFSDHKLSPTFCLAARTFLLLGFLSLGAGRLAAQHAVCALLTPDDVAPLLGGPQPAKPGASGESCNWGHIGMAQGKQGLFIIAQKAAGTEGPFKLMREQAVKHPEDGGKDEPGLGDQAFSQVTPSGVSLSVLKKGRVLNFQYNTGKLGTTKDAEALCKVAKKAVASF